MTNEPLKADVKQTGCFFLGGPNFLVVIWKNYWMGVGCAREISPWVDLSVVRVPLYSCHCYHNVIYYNYYLLRVSHVQTRVFK